eukprot:TRINITY_DN24325_c0_g1_i1.p1 TRINITY_DN24325_c0_g1~~TRINITY_DN24325_c0_g1_i1.p1  ORF type:complete len:400 (+),score=98.96 TRINITY_DN24325_c0_g1_i1:88-1287(+)
MAAAPVLLEESAEVDLDGVVGPGRCWTPTSDPDEDAIWGLLGGACAAEADCNSESSSTTAAQASNHRDASDAVCTEVSGDGAPQVPDAANGGDDSEASEAEELAEPTVTRFSAVVDKAEVSPELFPLPQDVGSTVTRRNIDGCDGYVLDGVLTPEECEVLIKQCDGLWSFWDNSDKPRVDFRNAHTIEVTHHALAERIWQRIAHLVSPSITIDDEDDPRFEVDIEGTWQPYSVNQTSLFARYTNGGHFAPHTDGTTVVDFNRRTFYTCVLYLNYSPWGGHTRIYRDEQISLPLVKDEEGRLTGDPANVLEAVQPAPGRMLVFYHRLMHEGVPAASKYIIRSDLFYHRTPELCTAPEDVEAFRLYEKAQLLAENGDCEGARKAFERCFKMSKALAKVYRM